MRLLPMDRHALPEGELKPFAEELVAAYAEAVRCGSPAAPDAWLRCYPELVPHLSAYFAERQQFDRLTAPLREAVEAVMAGAHKKVMAIRSIDLP